MRRAHWVWPVACALLGACAPATPDGRRGNDQRAVSAADAVRDLVMVRSAHLDSALVRLDSTVHSGADSMQRHRALLKARVAYKSFEFATEYFMPTVARALNGAPIDEIDDEEADRPLRPAEGLQVIAGLLDSLARPGARDAVQRELSSARSAIQRARQVTLAYRYSDAQLFAAVREEIARVTALGLTGIDAHDDADLARELDAALEGVAAVLQAYAPPASATALDTAWTRADRTVRAARQALQMGSDRTSSESPLIDDRLALLVQHLRPMALAVDDLRVARQIEPVRRDLPWRASAASIMETDALNPMAFAHASAMAPSPARIALGARLFHDVRLSGAGTRSCAFCHDPARSFTDGRTRAQLLPPSNRPTVGQLTHPVRNTPTLLNAALSPSQLADGRVAFLEDQVVTVVHDQREMAGDLTRAAAAMQRSGDDRQAFAMAFGEAGDSTVTPRRVSAALAAYVRSLAQFNAPFDRFVRGDSLAMSAEAQRGFSVFMGKARCGTCHVMPTFSGVAAPRFDRAEYEVIGVPSHTNRRRIDDDRGRGAVVGNRLLEHAFRTPSLRDVARTAPYMHNGVFASLRDVVDFYDAGGGRGMGLHVPNQTLPADSLHLTASEKQALIAFMGSLSSPPTAARPIAGPPDA